MWYCLAIFSTALAICVTAESADEAPLVAVYAIRGKSARLPCNITTPEKDSVVLVLWYKNGTKTPVYSVDSRNKPINEGKRWTSKEIFGERASFKTSGSLSHLIVKETKFDDEGLYRCRVDFRTHPTHIGRVNLHIVDPPRSVRLYASEGVLVGQQVSVVENMPLTLICRTYGGDPPPVIQWWSNGKLILENKNSQQNITAISVKSTGRKAQDSNRISEAHFPEKVVSKLILQHENITCTASNNPEIEPLSISVLLNPTSQASLSVDMTAPTNPLTGGKEYEVPCQAEGVQPPPTITWVLGGKVLTENIATQRVGLTQTKSVLRLKAGYADDGSKLECQATAPSISSLKDSHTATLHVNYVPEAKIKLQDGRKIAPGGGFSEGASAIFTCETRANPPTYNITFLFNGRPLHQKDRAIITKSQLTLNNLTHSDAGLYTCVASNSVGDGQSNAVGLHINYAPVCKRNKPKEIVALSGETVKLVCDVVASPKDIKFDWKAVSKDSSQDKLSEGVIDHLDEETISRGSFIMTNVSKRIRIQCSASNQVGNIKRPCLFDLNLVELPGLLIGCKQDSVTSYSANITCSPGTTGGLVLKFHLKVRDIDTEKIIYESTTQTPKFSLSTLDPGRTYAFIFYAAHSKGRGPESSLLIRTLNPQAEQVVNPNLGDPSLPEAPSPEAPNYQQTEARVSMPLIAGISAGVVVAFAVVIAVVVKCKWQHIYRRACRKEDSCGSPQGGRSSRESLLDLREASAYHTTTPTQTKEVLTSLSPTSSDKPSTSPTDISTPVPILSKSSTPIPSSLSSPNVSPRIRRGRRSLRFKDVNSVHTIESSSTIEEKSMDKCMSDVERSSYENLSQRDRSFSCEGPDLLRKPLETLQISGEKEKNADSRYFGPSFLHPTAHPVYYNPTVVFHPPPSSVSPLPVETFAQHGGMCGVPTQMDPSYVLNSSTLATMQQQQPQPPASANSFSNNPLVPNVGYRQTNAFPSNQGLGWRIDNLRKMELIRLQHNKERESGAESGNESLKDSSSVNEGPSSSSSRRNSSTSLNTSTNRNT